MKIPVGILTYKRAAYLKRTVESFLDLNSDRLEMFPLILLVQGGYDKNTDLVIDEYYHFFNRILISKENLGCAEGYNEIMGYSLMKNTELVMHLQDDWESREPLSKYIDEIIELFNMYKDIGYIRLRAWGIGRRVCKKNRLSKLGIEYNKVSDNIAKSTAHYTFNPTIIRSSVLKQILPFTEELDAMRKYHNLNMKAAQLYAHCFLHIGAVRAFSKGVWIK